MSTATVKKTTKTAATRATAQGSATKRTTVKKATNKTKTAKRTATRNIPTEHDIRQRAFELYVTSGCQPGRELQDWLQAEKELRKN